MWIKRYRSHPTGPTLIDETGDPPPLPYPQGWFCLATSDEVRPGSVITRRLAGKDVVVYRTRRGFVRVIQPYCPHLGAHLGAQGKVEGENIVCAFHNFSFSVDGTCVRTGYGKRVPAKARLEQLAARESEGLVWVWYDESGNVPTRPVPSILMAGMRPRRYFSQAFELVTHVQDIYENVVDVGHFYYVHKFVGLSPTSPPVFDGQVLRAGYLAERKVPLLGVVGLEYTFTGIGMAAGLADFRLGPASFRFVILTTHVAPWRVRWIVFGLADLSKIGWLTAVLRRTLENMLSRLLVHIVVLETRPDYPIWSYKRYRPHPRLAEGDGLIGRYRRWAKQFYGVPESVPQSSSGRPPSDSWSAERQAADSITS